MAHLQFRIERSWQVLDDLDRPFTRHLHRSELATARRQIDEAWVRVQRLEVEIEDLERQARPRSKTSPVVLALAKQEKKRKGELTDIYRELAADAVVRANAGLVDEVVLQHVGPGPSRPDVRVLWDEPGGLIAQHRAAVGVTGTSLLG